MVLFVEQLLQSRLGICDRQLGLKMLMLLLVVLLMMPMVIIVAGVVSPRHVVVIRRRCHFALVAQIYIFYFNLWTDWATS
jgi:hypothetical protein